MDLWVSLSAVLLPSLIKIGKTLVENSSLDPLTDQGLDQLGRWIDHARKNKKAENELKACMMSALDEVRKDTPDAFERLKMTQWVTGKDAGVYDMLAAAAVEMNSTEPGLIPHILLQKLNIDESQWYLLTNYLLCLRSKLAVNKHFKDLIDYINQLDRRELIDTISQHIIEINVLGQQFAELYGLETNDAIALKKYIEMCCQHWSSLALPLVRKNIGRLTPPMKRIFVPLQVRVLQEGYKVREEIEENWQTNHIDKEDEVHQSMDFYAAFAKYPLFILLGLPGSGKTTLLRRAALAFAENRPHDIGLKGEVRFPVFVRLRNFGVYLQNNREKISAPGAGALISYLEQYLRNDEDIPIPQNFFEERLSNGECAILLDGLDEVLENRVEVAQMVNAFILKYRRCGNRIGLSSRPRGYEGDVFRQLTNASLPVLEALSLNPSSVRRLIRNLLPFIESNRNIRETDVQKLSGCILSNKNLSEIAGIPLFCSALVQVYKYHGAELPQRRVDVLSEIADLLLGFWHAQSTEILEPEKLARYDGTGQDYLDTGESVEIKFNRLAYIAYVMQEKLGQVEISTQQVKKELSQYLHDYEGVPCEKARRWAKNFLYSAHLQSGLFVESNQNIHSFLHKNFQEYFAASWLLSEEDDPLHVIKSHLDDSDWEEVLLLAASHPKTTNTFRRRLIQEMLKSCKEVSFGSEKYIRRLWLSGRMAGDMTSRLTTPARRQLETELFRAATNENLKPIDRASHADVLDHIWRPEDLYDFVQFSKDESSLFFIAKYPVTNVQYERFLRPENFDDSSKHLWSGIPKFSSPDSEGRIHQLGDWDEQGWKWLLGMIIDEYGGFIKGIVYPRFWQDPRLGMARPHAPVVGITWWETNAYCRWLQQHWTELPEGKVLPQPVEIRLPTEVEWVYAAGGEEDGRYAWGKLPDQKDITQYANTRESGIGQTTPVWMYSLGKGRSYPLMDLSGNVNEWQANVYRNDQDWLSLRGGSWFSHYGMGACAIPWFLSRWELE